jgi:dihydropteroate synthase
MRAALPPLSATSQPGAAPGTLEPAPPWRVGPARWDFQRPLLLGVLNVTPDSFSDGGAYLDPDAALRHARRLAAEGADALDVGGASSHPRAREVSADAELARIAPVVERLLRELPLPVSIDTQRPRVAEACLALGAHLINDVSGLVEPDMLRVCAAHDAPLVITYNNFAVPKQASGLSFLSDMLAFFDERLDDAEGAGLSRAILDPGYGFGKSLEENLLLLRGLPLLRRFNRPVLVCTSRKGSLGRLTGEEVPAERLGATLASSLYAITRGAHLVRVHDVRAMRQAVLTWRAIEHMQGEAAPGRDLTPTPTGT